MSAGVRHSRRLCSACCNRGKDAGLMLLVQDIFWWRGSTRSGWPTTVRDASFGRSTVNPPVIGTRSDDRPQVGRTYSLHDDPVQQGSRSHPRRSRRLLQHEQARLMLVTVRSDSRACLGTNQPDWLGLVTLSSHTRSSSLSYWLNLPRIACDWRNLALRKLNTASGYRSASGYSSVSRSQ